MLNPWHQGNIFLLSWFLDSQGWFRTGDLAKVCKEGLILSGRNKEIINKSGEKFAPLQIEEVYLQHPLIKDRNHVMACDFWISSALSGKSF